MLRTTYLNLKKPEGSDPVNVQDFNDNADTIDTEVNARVKSSGGDIANTKVSAFTASTASYPVPAAGETPKVFMGKIKKFFEDFKSFKDSVVTKTMIINQILNDSTKAASAATVYSVNEKVDSAISDLANKADSNVLPKTVHTSITGNGSDYYDIACPGIKYGNTVLAQFASQRNEYYILNADAMADNKVRIIVNKAVPAGTGIYVNAIYSAE